MKRALAGWIGVFALIAGPAMAQEPGAGTATGAGTETETDTTPPSAFTFGSYGRVSVAGDLRGRTGSDADFVLHGPRIDESSYAELELRREDHFGAIDSRVVATLAIGGPLFHFDGTFDAQLAVRNLYAEVDHVFDDGLALWVGSRMVRGDDVYLLDFWPLDNLNMVGGGAKLRVGENLDLGIHGGLSRPNEPFYTQTVTTTPVSGFLPTDVLLLDRPRFVLATKGTYFFQGRSATTGLKLVLYAEAHAIASGERRTESGANETLPRDEGFVLGGQLGAYCDACKGFANLFVRYARGLGAYDPLGIPFRVGSVVDTSRAEEMQVALSASFERGPFGVQLGGYYRRFRDADPSVFERTLVTEGALTARPLLWIGEHAGIAGEVGVIGTESAELDEVTGEARGGMAWKLGLMPFVSPAGRGNYTRPHLRLIYALTLRSEGARALYPMLDPRSTESAEHFFGVGVEWWFQSSSYQ